MKLYQHIIYSILISISLIPPIKAQSKVDVKCIVLDAGHGGKDPGAVNGKLQEKNITLSVALKVGAMIKERYPSVKVLYTRKEDVFIPLHQRSNFANKNNADLFISIHTNAAENRAAVGTETFLMGVDKSGKNLEVAMRENDVITFEADYSTRYEGFEPGSAESFIIFSLMNYAHQSQSLELATLLQKEFAANLPMKNRGVKQAGYLVLWQATMPSILTEIGFISNHEEAKFIASADGQTKIASQIVRAVSVYIAKQGGTELKVDTTPPSKPNQTTQTKPQTQVQAQAPIEVKKSQPQKTTDGVYYRILVRNSQNKLELNSKNFGQYVTVAQEIKWGKMYKYYIEMMFSYKEALFLQQKMVKLFPSCTVEAFKDGERITIEQAKKIKP